LIACAVATVSTAQSTTPPDAQPLQFEVATIKPSDPDLVGRGVGVRGHRFTSVHASLIDLIAYAYSLHNKQVIGPEWVDTEKFDIVAQPPDSVTTLNQNQGKQMLQKLLADRFQLRFHQEKKEMAAYVLGVSKTGSKLTVDNEPDNGTPSLSLPGFSARKFGEVTAHNARLGDFAQFMQSIVLDRPVVDQTGLTERYNFTLNWTPDETQFAILARLAPQPEAGDAPSLFTAIREQLGLTLEPKHVPVPVFVIDHAEQPTPN